MKEKNEMALPNRFGVLIEKYVIRLKWKSWSISLVLEKSDGISLSVLGIYGSYLSFIKVRKAAHWIRKNDYEKPWRLKELLKLFFDCPM